MAQLSQLDSVLSNLHRHVKPNPFEAPSGNVVRPARPERAVSSHSMVNINNPGIAILLFKILGGLSVYRPTGSLCRSYSLHEDGTVRSRMM
jgi:hypothetical protein